MYDQHEINQRLLKVAAELNIKNSELAKQMGINRQFITQWQNNTGTPPLKRLVMFLAIHKNINPRWLLFGEGEMLNDKIIDQVNEPAAEYKPVIDKRIQELEDLVAQQKEFIDKLLGQLKEKP